MTSPSGVPAPESPSSTQRLAARSVAAAAVMVLFGGAGLLGLESCAQTSTSKPIQANPNPNPNPEPTADPAPQPDPGPSPEPVVNTPPPEPPAPPVT